MGGYEGFQQRLEETDLPCSAGRSGYVLWFKSFHQDRDEAVLHCLWAILAVLYVRKKSTQLLEELHVSTAKEWGVRFGQHRQHECRRLPSPADISARLEGAQCSHISPICWHEGQAFNLI